MLEIMECRRNELERTLNALNESSIPLVSVYNNEYSAAGGSDDKGMFYFIPSIAKFLGISSDQAVLIFYIALIVFGVGIATSGFSLLFKSWYSRLISFCGVSFLTGFLTCWFGHSDVYLSGFFAVATVVPLFLYLSHRPRGFDITLIVSLILSGIIIGYCNLLRHHAGTGVLIFLLLWVFINRKLLNKEKIICFSILIASFLIPYWHFYNLEKGRDAFLTQQNPSHQKSLGFPTWHIIYNGFGYLNNNKYGLEYSDLCAQNAALKINPNVTYLSDEYSQILKNLTFDLVKNDFGFVFQTVLAKIKNLLYKVMVYANFGLLLCLFIRPSKQVFLPLLAAALFYSIPGILVMPIYFYLSGMVSTLVIFALYMINLSLGKFLKRERLSVDNEPIPAK